VLFAGHREKSPVGYVNGVISPRALSSVRRSSNNIKLFDISRTIPVIMGSLLELAPTQDLGPHTRGGDDLDLARVLHALSDPIRLRIVAQLSDGREHTCGSFGLPVAKSTSSHHFRVLREAGVVATRIDGKNRFNRLERDLLEGRFPGLLDAVLRAKTS
jgi:DNA-binding transcriptional ArsR family regulator